jgi:SAM-dependent methyltransferase
MTGPIRRLFKDGYDTADWLLAGLVRNRYWINSTAKVLDFGCGAGALVYRFRDIGFDAYGFDIHDYVELRSPEDRKLFGFAPQDAVKKYSMEVRAEHVRTPFADDTFDLVVSTSVLEHVLDHDALMAEIARVLKPEGLAVHVYPGRASFIEPHIYVPLGTWFQKWWWLYLWAHLGGRSDFQHEMTARQVADANVGYCSVGLNYPTRSELLAITRKSFDEVRIVSWKWHSLIDRFGRPVSILRGLLKWAPLKAIAMTQLLDVMLTSKKKLRPR